MVHECRDRASRTPPDDEIYITWTLADSGILTDAESIILALPAEIT